MASSPTAVRLPLDAALAERVVGTGIALAARLLRSGGGKQDEQLQAHVAALEELQLDLARQEFRAALPGLPVRSGMEPLLEPEEGKR